MNTYVHFVTLQLTGTWVVVEACSWEVGVACSSNKVVTSSWVVVVVAAAAACWWIYTYAMAYAVGLVEVSHLIQAGLSFYVQPMNCSFYLNHLNLS
jgi:hypothetical protein